MLINRRLQPLLADVLSRGNSVLLLRPRQTGKTTLVDQVKSDLTLTFSDPRVRQRYEKNPGLLIDEIMDMQKHTKRRLRVVLDEVQKVPSILDSAQFLIDKKAAQFINTGSSARKLKRGVDVNLLPGRVTALRMNPLTLSEFPSLALKDILNFGTLPKIAMLSHSHEKEQELDSYVTTYLEEEVRAEALVRNIGLFQIFGDGRSRSRPDRQFFPSIPGCWCLPCDDCLFL